MAKNKTPSLTYLATGEQATPEQIEAWKQVHGDVFELSDAEATDFLDAGDNDLMPESPAATAPPDARYVYVKLPSRQVLFYAAERSQKEKGDGVRFTELVLKNIWLAGHQDFLTDTALMMSIGRQLEELIGIKDLQLKKL